MELLKIFLIAVTGVMVGMLGLQLFARWKSKRMEGREIKGFGKNIVLYFYSPGCGVCKKMEPVVESISRKVKIRKIDVSQKDGLQVARELGILGTPTTVVVRDGKVAKVFLGYQKEERILKEVM